MNVWLKNTRPGQQGNVLFLILIAVALFAALSYVVTNSNRSTAGSVEKDENRLYVARIHQYIVGLRTATQRMLFNGATPATLRLHKTGFDWNPCTNEQYCVFDQNQGGTIYIHLDSRPELDMYSNQWYLTEVGDGFTVAGIGTDAGPDVMIRRYFKPTAKGRAICEEINRSVGVSGVPSNPTGQPTTYHAAPGQPVACIDYISGGYYMLYAVLAET